MTESDFIQDEIRRELRDQRAKFWVGWTSVVFIIIGVLLTTPVWMDGFRMIWEFFR